MHDRIYSYVQSTSRGLIMTFIKSFHGSYLCFDQNHAIRDIEKALNRKFTTGTKHGKGAGGQSDGYYFFANKDESFAFNLASDHATSRAEGVWLKYERSVGTVGTACTVGEKALPLIYEVNVPYPSQFLLADYELAATVLGSWFYDNQDTIRKLTRGSHPNKKGAVIIADADLGQIIGSTIDSSVYSKELDESRNFVHQTEEGDSLFNLSNFIVHEPTGLDIDSEDDEYDAYSSALLNLEGDPDTYMIYFTADKKRSSLKSLAQTDPSSVYYWDFRTYLLERSGVVEHIVNTIVDLADAQGIDLSSDLFDKLRTYKKSYPSKSAFKWVGKTLPIDAIYVGYTEAFAEGWEEDFVEGWLRVKYEGVDWQWMKVSPKGLTKKQKKVLEDIYT